MPMTLETFIADSAADAVEQIRRTLGPSAVVVNVRQLPPRWFGRGKIEVQAHLPEQPETGKLLDVTDEPSMPAQIPEMAQVQPAQPVSVDDSHRVVAGTPSPGMAVLESLGLLPVVAAQVLAGVESNRPGWMPVDVSGLRTALRNAWRPALPAPAVTSRSLLHVFVGAPGVGKTTTLCKWLTLATLLEGRRSHVWRLDGASVNTSEALGIHGDILGVPVERTWSGAPADPVTGFVDLPGVAWSDANAVRALAGIVTDLARKADVMTHVVVNAAYESPVWIEQVRAFERELPVADVIVTHLDEELRWGKLWNVVVGTGFPVRFLSSGQNVPGEFAEASVERVLTRVFAGENGHGK